MISEEMLKQILEGASKYQEVVVHHAADLIDQVLAFYIFDSVLSILKWAAIFIFTIIIRRFIRLSIEESSDRLSEEMNCAEKCKQRYESVPYDQNEKLKSEYWVEFCRADNEANFTKKHVGYLKGVRFWVTIISACIFIFLSIPHLRDIGKIMVAPKLFVIEKSVEILKPELNKTGAAK